MDINPVEIILIEDNPSDVKLTLKALQRHNLENKVRVIEDGAEALDYLLCEGKHKNRKCNDNPKVIFLDLKLPLIDGKEVLKKIKSNDKTKKIPVVILTSSKESKDIEECYKLGANSYIVKPVNFEKFIDSVSKIGLYWLILNEKPV